MEIDELDDDFRSIPDYKEFIESVSKFDEMHLADKSIFEINKLYYSTFKILPFSGFSSPFLNHKFYRTRTQNTIGVNEDLNLVKTFSYPPMGICGPGRANRQYSSVFYCADKAVTTYYECKMKPYDTGYTGIWECINEQPLNYTCFLPIDTHPRNRWINHQKILFGPSLNSVVFGKSAQEEFIKDYIANRYVKEIYPYPLTSFISDVILFGNHFNFFIYPSIQTNLATCNFAFSTKTVDTHMKLKQVVKFHIKTMNESTATTTIDQIGTVVDDKILWNDPTPDEYRNLIDLYNK